MSHITMREGDTRDQQIGDLIALHVACTRCGGLEFDTKSTTFRTWASDHGRLAGDWPLPEGYKTLEELQKDTVGVIRLPAKIREKTGTNSYEIGVVKSRKFPGTYSLAYDFWGGAIDALAGKNLGKLQAEYKIAALQRKATQLKDKFTVQQVAPGIRRVVIDTTTRLGG